ncbi:MAG: hypothetical protein V1802_00965 [Candidatus Aenigmatarchaeota archaeon]
MSTQTQDMIQGKTPDMPNFALGKKITDYSIKPQNPKVYRDAPTLAELRHAFETSPEYRQSVDATKGKGE